MLGIPYPFILSGDDAVISGDNDGSGERCAIQFLDVDHLLQRYLLTLLGAQLFDKRQFRKKEETGKEITTLLQPQRTIFREEEKQMSQFMNCRETKFLYATLSGLKSRIISGCFLSAQVLIPKTYSGRLAASIMIPFFPRVSGYWR